MISARHPGFRVALFLALLVPLMSRGALASRDEQADTGRESIDPFSASINRINNDIPWKPNASDNGTLRIGVLDQSRSGTYPISGNWSFATGSVYSDARALLQNPSYFGPSGTVKRSVTINSISSITETTLNTMDVFILIYTNNLQDDELNLLNKFVLQGGALLVISSGPPSLLGAAWSAPIIERYGNITPQGYASPLINGPFGSVSTIYLGANNSATNIGQGVAISTNASGPNMLMFRPDSAFSGLGRAVMIGDEEIFMSGNVSGQYSGQMDFSPNQTFFLNIMAFLAGAPGYQPDLSDLTVGVLDQSRSGNFPISGNWSFATGSVYSSARSLLQNPLYFGDSGTVKRPVDIISLTTVTEAALSQMDVFILIYTNNLQAEEVRLLNKFVLQGGALLVISSGPPSLLGAAWRAPIIERYGNITPQGYASPLINGPFGSVSTIYLGANNSATNIGQGVVISTNASGPNMLMFRPDSAFSGLGRAVMIGDEEIFMSGNVSGQYSGQMDFSPNQTFFLNIMAFLAGAPGYQPNVLMPRMAEVGAHAITWSWNDNIPDETGFKIWADASTTTPTTLRTTTAANVTSWTMTSLLPNTAYSFRMAATFASGEDSSVTAPITARTAIEPVASLVFSNVGTNRIDVAPGSPSFSHLTDGKSGLLLTNKTLGMNSGWRQTTEAWSAMNTLTPNTAYPFSGKSRNADGFETASTEDTQFTHAGPPTLGKNVACDRQVLKGFPLGTAFTFSNPLGFGPSTHGGSLNKVSGFRYAWNNAASYAFVGTEPLWDKGALVRTTSIAGPYYLHLQSVSGGGVANPVTLDWGPFNNTPPAISAVTISPAAPGTLDTVAAIVSAADPDAGDSIMAYRYEWLLDGEVKTTSTTLSADLTTRGQLWTLRSWAQDRYGQWSEPSQTTFMIVNTLPSQPIVEIKPKPVQAGHDLIVDIQVYSTDPDGDTVAYDFQWFKSTDGGQTWIHKVELDGMPQVSGSYINEGELWDVHYIPYEKKQVKPEAGKPLGRVEGQYGWDRAYIGTNNPPKLTLETPLLQRQSTGTMLSIGWDFSDADKETCTIDLYWMTKSHPNDQVLAKGLSARQGTWRIVGAIPLDKTLTVHGVIHDPKGAVAQKMSAPAVILPPATTLIVNYLLGKSGSPTDLDVDGNRQVNVADLVRGVAETPPEIPSKPSPASGATAISTTPTLYWADSTHAKIYLLYVLWANTARPVSPTVSGLGVSNYAWKTALTKNTNYWWQVVAVNGTHKTTGPVWSFKTNP